MMVATMILEIMQLQPDSAMAKTARNKICFRGLMCVIRFRIKLGKVVLFWDGILKAMIATTAMIDLPFSWITVVMVMRLAPQLCPA